MKKKITGLVIFLFVILIAIGPNLVKFLDLPTIIVILGCGSGLTLLESNEKKSRGDNVLALKKNFVFSGWFISLVGIIMVFVSDTKYMFPNLSIALLGIFYGYIFSFVAELFNREN